MEYSVYEQFFGIKKEERLYVKGNKDWAGKDQSTLRLDGVARHFNLLQNYEMPDSICGIDYISESTQILNRVNQLIRSKTDDIGGG